MSLGMELGLGPGDFVLDGDPAPSPKRGRSPPPKKKSAHAYCGQTAGCIKMPLGMEVGLSPGDVVLDGDPALLKGVEPSRNFRSMSIVANMDVATFEATEAVASVVFTTLASVKTIDQLNFKHETHD